MQHIEVTRVFAAPPETVWRHYTDHAGWSDWAGLGRVRLGREGDGERDGVGCVRVISNGGMSIQEEIVAFEPPRHMAYRLIKGAVPLRNHRGEVDFTAEGEGKTRITWRCQFDSSIPGLGGLLRWGISRMFANTLRRLDERLAHQEPAAAPAA